MTSHKLINVFRDIRIALFFIILFILVLAGSRITLIPTGDEIHRIIQSHSLVYDLDIDMRKTYDSKKFFEWACCDRHILPQSYDSSFSFVYNTADDIDKGEWISKSKFTDFPKRVKITVENYNTIKIFEYVNSDNPVLYMQFEPDPAGNNIIRNLGYPDFEVKSVDMKNGLFGVIFNNSLYTSITVINFKNDKASFWANRHLPGGIGSYMFYNGSIKDRNKKLGHTIYINDNEKIDYENGLNDLERDFRDTAEMRNQIILKSKELDISKKQILSHSIGPSIMLLPVSLISRFLDLNVDKYISLIKIYINILWALSFVIIFNIALNIGCEKKTTFIVCSLLALMYPASIYASSANADSFGFILVTLLINGYFYLEKKNNNIYYFLFIISICILPWFHFRYFLISIIGILLILFIEIINNNNFNIFKVIKKYKISILLIIISMITFQAFENFKIQDGRIPASGTDLMVINLTNFIQQNIRLFMDPFEGILIPFALSIFGFAGVFILIRKLPIFSFLLLLIFSINMLGWGLAPENNYWGLYYGMRYHIAYLPILFIGIIYFVSTIIKPAAKRFLNGKFDLINFYYLICFMFFLSISLIPTYWVFIYDQMLSSKRILGPSFEGLFPVIVGSERSEISIISYLYLVFFFLIFLSLIYKNLFFKKY